MMSAAPSCGLSSTPTLPANRRGLPLFVYEVEVSPIEAAAMTTGLATRPGGWHLVGVYEDAFKDDRVVLQTSDHKLAFTLLDLDDMLAQEARQERQFAERHEWYTPRAVIYH